MASVKLTFYDEHELNFWIDTFSDLVSRSKDTAYSEVLAELKEKKDSFEQGLEEVYEWFNDD